MIDLNELKWRAFNAIKQRKENGAVVFTDIEGTLKHCAGEVVEAVSAYHMVLRFINEADAEIHQRCFSDELADVIVCVMVAAYAGGVDLEAALLRVVERNEVRARKEGDKL